MHCRSCGSPSYQDPCASCVAKTRDRAEQQGRDEQPAYAATATAPAYAAAATAPAYAAVPISTLHNLFHAVWTKNVGGHDYDKSEWMQLDSGFGALCRQLGFEWQGDKTAAPEDPTVPTSS